MLKLSVKKVILFDHDKLQNLKSFLFLSCLCVKWTQLMPKIALESTQDLNIKLSFRTRERQRLELAAQLTNSKSVDQYLAKVILAAIDRDVLVKHDYYLQRDFGTLKAILD